ncbi:hypothetical protein ACKWTF_014287 [Chironomus riparius]
MITLMHRRKFKGHKMFTFTIYIDFPLQTIGKRHADNETSRQWHMNGDEMRVGVGEEGGEGDKLQNSNIIFTQKTMKMGEKKFIFYVNDLSVFILYYVNKIT